MGFSLEEGEREHTVAGEGGVVCEAGGRVPLPVYQVLVVLWVLCLHVALLQQGVVCCLPGYMYKSKPGTCIIWKTSKWWEGN